MLCIRGGAARLGELARRVRLITDRETRMAEPDLFFGVVGGWRYLVCPSGGAARLGKRAGARQLSFLPQRRAGRENNQSREIGAGNCGIVLFGNRGARTAEI